MKILSYLLCLCIATTVATAQEITYRTTNAELHIKTGGKVTIEYGSENCTGDFKGHIVYSNPHMALVVPDNPTEDSRQCSIKLNFDRKKLDLVEDECQEFHGIHCSFSDTYTRYQPAHAVSFSKTAMISEIKRMYQEIESGISRQIYRSSKREESFEYGGASAALYRDNNNHIRKLHCEMGSEDSGHTAAYYYRPDGTLFFSFVTSANVAGCSTELRSYFDHHGRLIKQKRKDDPKCGYPVSYKPVVSDPQTFYKRLEP